MLCKLFRNQGMGLCDAVADDHIPTVLERERYCFRGDEGCPILGAYLARGNIPLDVNEYLETWSRPPGRPDTARDMEGAPPPP
jgi:hypothetical protein